MQCSRRRVSRGLLEGGGSHRVERKAEDIAVGAAAFEGLAEIGLHGLGNAGMRCLRGVADRSPRGNHVSRDSVDPRTVFFSSLLEHMQKRVEMDRSQERCGCTEWRRGDREVARLCRRELWRSC